MGLKNFHRTASLFWPLESTVAHRLVLAYLAIFTPDAGGTVALGLRYLAHAVGLTPSGVRKVLRCLAEWGFIHRVGGGHRGQATIYELSFLKVSPRGHQSPQEKVPTRGQQARGQKVSPGKHLTKRKVSLGGQKGVPVRPKRCPCVRGTLLKGNLKDVQGTSHRSKNDDVENDKENAMTNVAYTKANKDLLIEDWKTVYPGQDPVWKSHRGSWVTYTTLSRSYPFEEIRRRWKLYLRERGDFFQGHSLAKFCSQSVFDRWAPHAATTMEEMGRASLRAMDKTEWGKWDQETIDAENEATLQRLEEKLGDQKAPAK